MIYTPQLIERDTATLLDGLYPDYIVGETARLAGHYTQMKADHPSYVSVPESLHGVTRAREMSDVRVEGPQKKFRTDLLPILGVYDGKTVHGPLNHILARMITIPMMIGGYLDHYPDENEIGIYTDPPLLQFSPDELRHLYDAYFAAADEALKDPEELGRRFRMLGYVGENVTQFEPVYPAASSDRVSGSTQAYELFGIFHLFPSNYTVDITSTSPGIILPTEADPLRFRDSVAELKKNLLRPTYFEMLKRSIDSDFRIKRRYSASRSGTAKNLAEYPQLLDAAKEILARYLALGKRFEIRVGEQREAMKLATLIGDAGVVYSVRDSTQKDKIAHNVTVMDPSEARIHRDEFEILQWADGVPITSTDILDELLAEGQKK